MSYEPWKLSNLPNSFASKSLELRKIAVDTANNCLEKGMTPSEAEFSALQAVTILERKDKPIKKSVEKKPVPQHLLAVLQKNVEEDTGSGWNPGKYTGRTLRLPNAQETELIVTANRYYRKGSKLRFYIWGDADVSLVSTNLPGTIPGTVVQPAGRLLIA